MLLAFQIKNFGGLSHTFSFFADRSNDAFSDHLIKITQNTFSGSFIPTAAFKLPSQAAENFFAALSFLRQLIMADSANLKHENCVPFLRHIQGQAEFSLVFRIFGTLYLYNLSLTQNKIVTESLYTNLDFNPQKPFAAEHGTCIFQRAEQNFPILNVHKDFYEYIKNTEAHACVLSLFKEKNEHTADLRAGHTWFRKELFDFHEQNFLDFMAERGNAEQGMQLLNGMTIQANELLPYLSPKQLQQFGKIKNKKFTVHCSTHKIFLQTQSDTNNAITTDFECSAEFLQKFLSCMHALKNEKYRLFILQNITDTAKGIFSLLLIKAFLTDRHDCFNQIFFSSSDDRLFTSAPLRKEELFYAKDPFTRETVPYIS